MSSPIVKVGSIEFPIENLNATKCSLRRKNQSSDELAITISGDIQFSNWQYGETVELWQNGVRRFFGKIEKSSRRESFKNKCLDVVVKSPFADFEKIIFQQRSLVWNNGTLVQKYRSKVVLGLDFNGEKLSAEQQARNIIEYAISQGAQCRLGEIDIESEMLFDECTDITCAEALKRVLKWSPACCLFFDYSQDGLPTVNILKRTSLESATINADNGTVKNFSANRRDDLAISSVTIKYERENISGENSYLELEEDVYPPNTENGAIGAVVMYVELGGAKSVCQRHTIATETVNINSKDWWRQHVSFLNEVANFNILETSRNGRLSKELVEGTIVDEMNCDFESDTICGTFFCVDKNGSELTKKIALKMVTTNASSGTFQIWTRKEIAETAPQGLARAVYEAASALQFDGEAELFDTKIENVFAKNVSIQEGENQISSSMPSYWCEENLLKNSVKIKFGPPKHLYADDIAEIFRINRSRKISNLSINSSSGKISASTIVIGGKNATTTEADSDETYARMVIHNQNLSNAIDLNCADLNTGQIANFKEAYVCINGELAKAHIISTSPIFV